MAQIATHEDFHEAGTTDTRVLDRREMNLVPAKRAYQALHVGFTLVLVIAGLDKFFQILADWNMYLAPQIRDALGGTPGAFMGAVGIIEIAAGIGVAIKPRVFAYVVSAWLLGIVLNLFMHGTYYDIALRDFGLAVGAFALGRLSQVFEERKERRHLRAV